MISFIGLGSMGLPIATNLVKAGFDVVGYDRRISAVEGLVQVGGRGARDVSAAAAGADALFLMVINAEQAIEVLFTDGGLEALAPEAVVVLMATCPPPAVVDIAARVTASGRSFIDAPVSGGVVGAETATLSIMASGPTVSFGTVERWLRAISGKLFHVGELPGQGAMAKTINQLLCGIHLAAAAEALSMAEKAGISQAVALEIVSGSAAASWMLRDRGPRMLQTDPIVSSAVDIFVKDLGIVLAAGADLRAALPLSAVAHQMFLAASGQGRGAEDDSRVIEAYRSMSALKPDLRTPAIR